MKGASPRLAGRHAGSSGQTGDVGGRVGLDVHGQHPRGRGPVRTLQGQVVRGYTAGVQGMAGIQVNVVFYEGNKDNV